MIKSGYQITLTSWENDGDNYKDITISGLTKLRVEYIISMCRLFTSAKHGNICEQDLDYIETRLAKDDMLEVAAQYHVVVIKDELDFIKEDPVDYMYQFLDRGEHTNFRVFEGYKVHFIPKDIIDVTNEFFNV